MNGWKTPKILSPTAHERKGKVKATIDYKAESTKANDWKMTNHEKRASEQRMKKLETPAGWSRATTRIWTHSGTLNAGDFIDFIEKDLVYAVKNFLFTPQFETTCKMLRVFRLLLKREHKKNILPMMTDAIRDALSSWNNIAPYFAKPKLLHLLTHIIDDIENFGNVSNFWMFPYERFIGM